MNAPVVQLASMSDSSASHQLQQRHSEEMSNVAEKQVTPPVVAAPPPSPSVFTWCIALVAVFVDALCPWLQEHVSKSPSFDSSTIVLAEVAAYCLGGIALATISDGLKGIRQCFQPSRYVAFLPSSLASTCSNIFTYLAVSGLGASQFYLLVQIRVAVLAVLLRVWRGVQQPLLAWLALLQLVLGMIVLVELRSAQEANENCWDAQRASPLSAQGNAQAGERVSTAAAMRAAPVAAATVSDNASDVSLAAAIFALGIVIGASSFGLVWLERQLKANSHEAVHVQVHQLNFFGLLSALCIKAHRAFNAAALEQSMSGVASANGTVLHAMAVPDDQKIESSGRFLGGTAEVDWRFFLLFLLLVSRGVLTVGLLKKLDSITKGLVDVCSIVVCTLLQIFVDGLAVDRVSLGLQFVLLLSISQYLVAKGSSAGGDAGASAQLVDSKSLRTISSGRTFFTSTDDDGKPSSIVRIKDK